MSTADERLTRLEDQVYEALPARIDDLAEGIASLHKDMDTFRRDTTRRFDHLDLRLDRLVSAVEGLTGPGQGGTAESP